MRITYVIFFPASMRNSSPITMFWVISFLVGLIVLFQTPILVDLLKVFFPEWRLRRFTNQAASSLLVVLMNTFFLIGLGMQVFIFIPLATYVPLTTFELFCHCVFAYWVWINMVVNYWFAVLVSPGTSVLREEPPQREGECRSGSKRTGDVVDEHSDSIKSAVVVDHGMNWQIKHSHYCSTCKSVTLYMDHHCPFTNSCIGLHNYSYFFLGLLYATIGQCYSVGFGFFYFGECILPGVWHYLDWAYLVDANAVCSSLEPYSELVLPVIAGLFVQIGLFLFQMFLLLADLTTYDIIKNFWTIPVFRYGWQRIMGGKYRGRESKLNVLLLKQRPHLLWLLLPVRNSDCLVPSQ